MSPETLRIIADLLLPPAGPIIIIALGLLMWLMRLRKLAALSIFVGTVLLYLASSPYISRQLLDPLQYKYNVMKEIPTNAQAIVVLAGGRTPIAREYNSLDTVKSNTLERLRYASRLAKINNLPILLVGGSVHDEHTSEAALMKQVLETDFGVPPKWLEEKSKNTFENAEFAAQILKENSITNFILVTHAYHMPRAMWCFQQFGLSPTPAPTIYVKRNMQTPEYQDYFPKASALMHTRLALHEYMGKLWYEYFAN